MAAGRAGRALEVEAARSASLRRTNADLLALDAALAAREAAWASGDAAAFVEADVVVHQTIVAAAHNGILAELYADFSAALRSSLADAIGPELTPDRYVDHARLVEAIRQRDPDRAATDSKIPSIMTWRS